MSQTVFKDLQALRERPIPGQADVKAVIQGYRSHPLDKDDARFKEPLVNVEDMGLAGRSFYCGPINAPYYTQVPDAAPKVLLREGVCRKLIAVNEKLADVGLEVFAFDGWRPTSVQAYFFEDWMPNEVRQRNPAFSEEEVRREVQRYWSAPTVDENSPAPHATGGAIDLTLRWKATGEHLWMGSIFDDVSKLARLDLFEVEFNDPKDFAYSHEEARANRRLLYWIMRDAGFAHNPNEWWHFSYGDMLWARIAEEPTAFYGLASA